MKNNKKQLLYVVPMLAFLFAILLYSNKIQKEIDQHLEKTNAHMMRIIKGGMGQKFIVFEYYVEDKRFERTVELPLGFCKTGDCFDKEYIIEYSTLNPQYCRIVIEGKTYKGNIKFLDIIK